MKTDLKSFPCGTLDLCKRNKNGERTYCHQCTKPEEWKERIEEELQQFKQDRVKLGEWIRLHSGVKTSGELLDKFIDEVLGVSEK